MDTISYDKHSVFAGCNSGCVCSVNDWDPVCGDNGITYVSPCLAGCSSSAGSGKNTVSSTPSHSRGCCGARTISPTDGAGVSLTLCVCVCVSAQVFSNCSCIGVAGNFTAHTGQCHHTDDCDRMFPYFLALSVITSFIISLGGTPGYMILIRSGSGCSGWLPLPLLGRSRSSV